MSVPFVYHPDMALYDFGEGHPFRADRILEFMRVMEERSFISSFQVYVPEVADNSSLAYVHTPSYIRKVHDMEKWGGHLSPDTRVVPGTVHAAKVIVGAAMKCVDLALDSGLALSIGGFHHAGPSYGEGFCLFNDVAIAAKYAIESLGLQKVMIIDTDAHQGNGTMDIFYTDPSVLYVSLHQDPRTLYPGRGFVLEIGHGRGRGFTVNVPMHIYSGDEQYMFVMDQIVRPLAEAYMPDLIVRNGGADPHFSDELTLLGMTLNGLRELASTVRGISREIGVPLVDLTISGYGGHTTPGWFAIWSGTTGLDLMIDFDEGQGILPSWITQDYLQKQTERTVEEVKRVLSEHWKM